MGNDDLIFDVLGVAEVLKVGRSTVYSLMNSGELRPIKIGARTLFTRDEIERFIAARTAAAAAPKPQEPV
jgi:excisionase family DNA binding protein